MIERINLWTALLVGRVQSLREDDGQALVEYALILALIAVVAVGALALLGTSVSSILNTINTDISGA